MHLRPIPRLYKARQTTEIEVTPGSGGGTTIPPGWYVLQDVTDPANPGAPWAQIDLLVLLPLEIVDDPPPLPPAPDPTD